MSANRTLHRMPHLFSIVTRTKLARAARQGIALLLLASSACAPVLAQTSLGTNPQPAMPNVRETNPYLQMGSGVTGVNQGQMAPGGASGSATMPSPAAAGGAQTVTPQGLGVLYPDPAQYVLSPGDLISVRLFGVADYIATVRISKDGTVQLPLIGAVNLGGITLRQGQDLIASSLKNSGMFRNPEVMIGVAESSAPSTISFAGEKSGLMVIQGERSLLDVIAASGGLPITAGRNISIIRPGVEAPIIVNLGNTPQDLMKANIPIMPRDVIFVERAGAVYVLGAFKTQGAFPIPPSGLSLMQAAAIASGPSYAGKYNDLRLIRTVGTERTEVKVDIKRIMFGQDPDPLLQAGDILFLPTTPLKQALAANGLGVLLTALSVLLITLYPR